MIPKNELKLKVRDRIACSALVVLLWNMGTDVEQLIQHENVNNDQDYEWEIRTKKNKKYLLSISINGQSDEDNISMRIFEGAMNPMLGWYAPGYLKKEPVKTIQLQFSPANQMDAEVVTQVIRLN